MMGLLMTPEGSSHSSTQGLRTFHPALQNVVTPPKVLMSLHALTFQKAFFFLIIKLPRESQRALGDTKDSAIPPTNRKGNSLRCEQCLIFT